MVTRALVSGDGAATRLDIELTAAIEAKVFLLADPPRVVVDLPEAAFRLDPASTRAVAGLVSAFRYGLLAPGQARIVLDVTGPVAIASARMVPVAGAASVRLEIGLAPTDAAAFAKAVVTAGPPPPTTAQAARPSAGRGTLRTRARPMVVIDAGHGGIDPGTSGPSGVAEKAVVLAVARQLRQALLASGQVDVTMTRSTDIFVPLATRLRISRQAAADLFVSIHADAVAEKDLAGSVRGATIYTLSDRASDETARQLAEKENAADQMAGFPSLEANADDDVRNILIDLMKRETANLSHDVAGLFLSSLAPTMKVARDPLRSAAFKVLRQTDAPSVLIELGYMSNPEDEKLLASPEWQRRIARALADAVGRFFAKSAAVQARP